MSCKEKSQEAEISEEKAVNFVQSYNLFLDGGDIIAS